MLMKKERDPFAFLRRLPLEFDRLFNESAWPAFQLPVLRSTELQRFDWAPLIDVFEREGKLVTRVDLPGLKKEDVKVDVADGVLTISGERKRETEEKKEQFYRSEREYGSFYRAVALPEGTKIDDIKATFANGVLEVTMPLPVAIAEKPRTIQIEDVPKIGKVAA
jgi:HSP20 family protein